MTDQKVELDTCPRSDCDEPIIESFRTDNPFQLRPDNVVHDKWCVIPRLDAENGKFWVYLIIHGDPEGFKTAKERRDDDADDGGDESQASADPNENAPDASDLPNFERRIKLYVEKEGSVKRAGILGRMADTGKSPDEIVAATEWLADEGYIEEIDDAVYSA